MELNFKDSKSAKLFDDVRKLDIKQSVVLEDDFSFDQVTPLDKKIETKSGKIKINNTSDDISKQQLSRIESKQNEILQILQNGSVLKISQQDSSQTSNSDIDKLKLNLNLFCSKLIILSTDSKNSVVKEILEILETISEHIVSNSLNLFTRDNSPVEVAIEKIESIGIGDFELNNSIEQTIKILKNIDSFSKQDKFEQSYNYANLMLSKGLVLNAITLFNESAGIYILDSAKSQSKEISKYIHLVGEQNCNKLYSQAKDFFINIFLEPKESPNTIPFFPHHKVVKDIDKQIENKFKNIQTTWRKKGDGALFEKYAYIVKRVRVIRNSLAHGNLEVGFRSLATEIKELNDDFYYLVINKNILKRRR